MNAPSGQPGTLRLLGRYAWLPIPLLLALIAALWVANLQGVHESRVTMVLLNLFFTWLASLWISLLTARGFLNSGQPSLLMFGCGSLVWGFTSLAAAVMVERVNTTITVHNIGVLGAALCHFAGVLWHGRISRPVRWLLWSYTGALVLAALIIWAPIAGVTPLFFVQGQGGMLVREMVLIASVGLFAWVAWQMAMVSHGNPSSMYYWYGLGLGLVATGLTGVGLLTVQGGVLGWTNRLTQYLGSAYLFVAACMAARETGSWELSLSSVTEALQDVISKVRTQRLARTWLWRYLAAITVVGAAAVLRLALQASVGPELPPFLTFYPAVMIAALMLGFGPGLLASVLSAGVVWIQLPLGSFPYDSPAQRIGLVVFVATGLFTSLLAGLYRRSREKAAAYDREAALSESRARLATFAEATFEGIIESESGQIVDCNEQLAQMLGYSVAELRGLRLADLVAPEDRDHVIATASLPQTVSEFAVLRKDGTRLVVEAHGRSLARGNTARHIALRDITSRKVAEEALREADRRKSEFLGVLSHELRNPLAPIRNSLFILHRAAPGDERALHARAVIERQVAQLGRLVDDLLDVTRIARGKIRLQRSRLDLVELVRRTVEDHRSLLESCAVSLELPSEPVWMNGDPVRLVQVVGNLLQNAAKFTPAQGKVLVSLAAAEGRAAIQVADNGVGIDAETRARLFEPFAQADRSLARSNGGLGMGLAIAKGLVDLHGGTIAASSEGAGKGASFTVMLPCAKEGLNDQEPRRPKPAQAPGRKVLVIEDSVDAAESLRDVLELSGHQVVVAHDGVAGIAKAGEFQPDVVFCDIGLPGDTDGYAVASALRRLPTTASAILVALTGYARPEDREHALEAGFDAHLAKPVDLSILEQLLAQGPPVPSS